MSKTITTSYLKAKYKGKYYYLAMYCTYSIDSTDFNSKKLTFSAGFRTKTRKLSMGTIKLTATATNTNGAKLSASKSAKFSRKTSSPAQTYISNTVWTLPRLSGNKTVTVNLVGTMGTTRFSGKKLNLTLKIDVDAKGQPLVSFVAQRNIDDAVFSIDVNAGLAGASITAPSIKYDETTVTPAWKLNGATVTFPHKMTSAHELLTATLADNIDEMHSRTYSVSCSVAGNSISQTSTITNSKDPIWKGEIEVNNKPLPIQNEDGTYRVRVYCDKGTEKVEIPTETGWEIRKDTETHWFVLVSVPEEYLNDGNGVLVNAKARLHIEYELYYSKDSEDVEQKTAIYETSRNCGYTTGLANNIFIGGCKFNNYKSRVWYSYPNNPTYIPDTNYIEVGSNDTAIMGLVKVGDYLGIIKQSKTTDTAVYLSYATSFDNETTFATKPCVGGVGAIGEFTFNVLGDETLFLSPNGVMAIEPNENEQSRVKNRSYYVDGRLLKEPNLESAYSFVWNGYYILCVNNKAYVLDGSQRNSWGNEKTNLVYECYYLENIPAKCVASFDNNLFFSDYEGNICSFKDDSDDSPFTDEGDPVSAEWSTIADDDGSLQYYKTFNKKGCVVSLLPEIGCTADVFIRKDEEPETYIGTKTVNSNYLPTDMFVKRKFKKYKRIQFIVRDDTANPFGINCIIKSYSIGNYAKK